jgi:hypothetical protein
MAIEITTPFPTLEETAEKLGVSKRHARRVHRLILEMQAGATTAASSHGGRGVRRGAGARRARPAKRIAKAEMKTAAAAKPRNALLSMNSAYS